MIMSVPLILVALIRAVNIRIVFVTIIPHVLLIPVTNTLAVSIRE
jgi:hypothetical protein